MSIYLEFPAIEDYPVYVPLAHFTSLIPDWAINAVQNYITEAKDPENGF